MITIINLWGDYGKRQECERMRQVCGGYPPIDPDNDVVVCLCNRQDSSCSLFNSLLPSHTHTHMSDPNVPGGVFFFFRVLSPCLCVLVRREAHFSRRRVKSQMREKRERAVLQQETP
jgi:hypothetical protein